MAKYIKLSLGMGISFVLGVISALLLCSLAIYVLGTITGTRGTDSGKSPRRTVDVTIETRHREELFDQLRKFGAQHDFKVIIDPMNPSGDEFLIAMYGKDVEIFGGNPFEQGEYEISLYDADSARPVSDSVLHDLVNDLKSLISEVPQSTFSVEEH